MNERHLEPISINDNIQHGQEETIIKKLFEDHQDFDGVFVSGCTLASLLYSEAINLAREVNPLPLSPIKSG